MRCVTYVSAYQLTGRNVPSKSSANCALACFQPKAVRINTENSVVIFFITFDFCYLFFGLFHFYYSFYYLCFRIINFYKVSSCWQVLINHYFGSVCFNCLTMLEVSIFIG